MDFDEWHNKQLNGDPGNCPHEAWERGAWGAATHECADMLSLNRSEAQLMAGEISASEWRTVAAVLKALQLRMRSNVEVTGGPLGETDAEAVKKWNGLPRTQAPNVPHEGPPAGAPLDAVVGPHDSERTNAWR